MARALISPACSASSCSASSCADAVRGEVEQRVELVAAERVAFGRALHLDEAAAVVHDDVHVGLGAGILGVVEIEHRHARRRCRPTPRRPGRESGCRACSAVAHERIARVGERDVAAGDRGRARAAVGLQHVAIERDGALAERLQIDDRAQRAADQALDFLRAPALLAAAPPRACVRVCVARGSMPYSAVTQPWPLPRRNGGTPSSTLAVHSTRVSPNSTSTEPSACRVKRRVKRTAAAHRARGRWVWLSAHAGDLTRCQRSARAAEVLSLTGADALHRALGRALPACRAAAALPSRKNAGDLGIVAGPPQMPSVHTSSTSSGLERVPAAQRHVRQERIAAEAALDEVAHRMIQRLLRGDQALAQQQLDVAVIAGALNDLAAARR